LLSGSTFGGGTTILGGTLKLAGAVNGFGGNGLGWAVNSVGISSTPVTNNVLTLTDNNFSEGRSAFYKIPLSAGAFTARYIYQTGGYMSADGAAFVLQNDKRGTSALGGGGYNLGYSGITPSVAVQYSLSYTQGTAFNTDGNVGGYVLPSGIGIPNGDPILTNVTYDGSSKFTEELTDLNTGRDWSQTYGGVNLAQIIGGNSLYVGFTGADGSGASTQTISNFVFMNSGIQGNNILPAGGAVRLGSGATLDMSGVSQTIASLADNVPGDTAGEKVLLSGGSLTVGDSSSTTFSGNITGIAGSLTKVGSGVLVLSGSNNYTGGTNVSAGQLILASGSAMADGTSLAVAAGGTLIFDPSASGSAVTNSASAVVVPEPSTSVLLGVGAIGLLGYAWRKLFASRATIRVGYRPVHGAGRLRGILLGPERTASAVQPEFSVVAARHENS
jgi:autotransporter-associated beta strand protein